MLAMLAVAALSLPLTAAHANPITYMFSGIGTGTLNGSTFTDQNFSLTFVGNTNDVVHPDTFLYQLTTFSSTAVVVGATNATITGGAVLFAAQDISEIGVSDGNYRDAVDMMHFSFASYALKSSFGPMVPTEVFAANTNKPAAFLVTSAGNLKFTSIQSASGGFQSIMAASVVPEANSLALLALSLPVLGTVATMRLRRRIGTANHAA